MHVYDIFDIHKNTLFDDNAPEFNLDLHGTGTRKISDGSYILLPFYSILKVEHVASVVITSDQRLPLLFSCCTRYHVNVGYVTLGVYNMCVIFR